MSDAKVLLGYAVGSGDPVRIPMLNLAVTGQTQRSGKTTTLEALVARSDATAIAFVTKRGERAFTEGRRVQPYFRDRADWRFVDALISAVLQEKNKFLRAWIMRTCRTTKTLADVHAAVKKSLRTAKREMDVNVYTQLDEYLELIVPDIKRAKLADTLALKPGLNVMNVSTFSLPMQMLFVQSALDWVNEFEEKTIVVVPEAWEFIPEGKGSPAKASAIALARKGSGIGNHIWVDSQDMAGVDKEILRGCPVWLIGVQREANELKRNLANIPKSVKRPTVDQIATLERGQFYACWETHAIKTYVRPAWMDDIEARSRARGIPVLASVAATPPKSPTPIDEDDDVDTALRAENERLKKKVGQLERQLSKFVDADEALTADLEEEEVPAPRRANRGRVADVNVSDELLRALVDRLRKESPKTLAIALTKPELEITIEREVIQADGSSLRGKIGRLIAKRFFDEGVSGSAVQKELARQGKDFGPGNTYGELDRLALMGFLTIEGGQDDRGRKRKDYRAVPDMKVNIVER